VRARRGYRAATEEEVTSARAAAASVVPLAVAAVHDAMAGLARLRSSTGFRIHAAPGAGPASHIWIAGEFRAPAGAPRTAMKAEIQVTGDASGTASVDLPAGQRTFLARVPLDSPAATRTIDVRARLTGAGTPEADVTRLDVATPAVVMFRRGPTTGNQWLPAGDPRFSRTERARLEVPVRAAQPSGAGRVLDRNGEALSPPVTVTGRTDEATGEHWLTAEVILAPLGPGDYVIELATGETRILTAVRVTR
jgi:hypothetical protein